MQPLAYFFKQQPLDQHLVKNDDLDDYFETNLLESKYENVNVKEVARQKNICLRINKKS